MKYEFQWGEAHAFSSVYNWICSRYGSYAFGKPEKVDFVAIVENSHVDSYASSEMIEEWQKMGVKLLDRQFALQLIVTSQQCRSRYWKFYDDFKKTDLQQLSNTELCELFKKFLDLLDEICVYFVVTQPEGTHAIEMHLKKLLESKFGGKAQKMFSLLTMPNEFDIIGMEQIELCKLGAKEKVTQEELEKYSVEHSWLLYQTFNYEKGMQFLKNRLEAEREIGKCDLREAELKKAKNELRAKQEAIFTQLKDEEIEYFCKLFQTWAHERLELKNCWAGAEWRFLPLFKEIAKRLQIALSDLVYGYSLEDIKPALLDEKLLSSELVRERKEIYAVRWFKGKRIEYRKKDIPALRAELGITELPQVSEINGTIANPGIARGRAYVVKVFGVDRLLEDEKKFRDGDIMVITMTQPSHIALVKKSAAIVADEGGVASHASVISREFGKPCIVGAKIATKAIKTGDLIEVNADKGIVRKLKNHD